MSDFNDFVNAQRGISESDLQALESLTGYQIPLAFKEHFLLFNGGEPDHCLYMLDGEPIVIQEFFPIRYGVEENTIEGNFRELVLQDKVIPSNLLPFGRDPGGDFYCLDMENGKVVVFRSEYLPDLNQCITEIATSMDEFLNGLLEDD